MTMAAELQVVINAPVDAVVERLRQGLQAKGFGVLTEIDVQSTLRAKLNEDFYPYKLLGVCNPAFAYRILEIDPSLGVFLLCTIAVYDTGAGTAVHIQDPAIAQTSNSSLEVATLGEQVRALLVGVVADLGASTP